MKQKHQEENLEKVRKVLVCNIFTKFDEVVRCLLALCLQIHLYNNF